MKIRSVLPWSLGALALSVTAAAFAHHPLSAKFDSAKETTLTGIVTAVDWRNPHTHVFMNVTRGNTVENWAVELESPIILRQSGWAADSLKPGDQINVSGMLARNGTRQVWGENVTKGGTAVYTVSDARPAPSTEPTPRWPDGTVALGTTGGGQDGYWSFPSETVLVEDGVNVPMDKYGLLTNVNDAAKVAPLQPWALGIYKLRQERQLQDDPMFINCKPPGGPRQFQSELGVQLLEDKENARVFALVGSGNRNYNIIYMYDRQTGLVTGDDDNPLYYGRSNGHWEDGTLVVNTKGFNEDFWFSNGGLPHTDLLQLEQRFTRTSKGTMEYSVTVNDPGAYTRPWTASWTLQWVDGEEMPVHFCQNNRQ
jgi:hypothetical protein